MRNISLFPSGSTAIRGGIRLFIVLQMRLYGLSFVNRFPKVRIVLQTISPSGKTVSLPPFIIDNFHL